MTAPNLAKNYTKRSVSINSFLHYQPQMDQSGQTIGAEALIRWRHPERGLIAPDAFIAEAEACGLIAPIGLWVVETACAQLAAWQTDAATST